MDTGNREELAANRRKHARMSLSEMGRLLAPYARAKAHAVSHWSIRPQRRSVVRDALTWLFPLSLKDSPWRATVAGLLGISVYTLRHWLVGRRAMTADAKALLIEMVKGKLEQGHAILAALENAPVAKPPGNRARQAALSRRAREQDAQARQE